MKRAVELEAAADRVVLEVLIEDRHQVVAQRVEARESKRIDDGQALGQGAVADLDGGPPGEVVAVRGGLGVMAEEVAERVEVDRVGRHLADPGHELALVVRVHVQRLAQLDTSGEVKRTRGGAHRRRGHAVMADAMRRSSAWTSRTPATRYSAAVGLVPTQIVTARPRSAVKADSSVVSSPA